jgi:hypothetical protein
MPFKVSKGGNGKPVIGPIMVPGQGKKTFAPEQISAMVLEKVSYTPVTYWQCVSLHICHTSSVSQATRSPVRSRAHHRPR